MIGIVVALPAEAQPIVDRFQLQRLPTPLRFRHFAGDDLALVVCGIGKGAVMKAMRDLLSHVGEDPEIGWLNVGIAGHRSHRRGRIFLAGQVHDRSIGRVWQQSRRRCPELPVANILTVDEPELEYPGDFLYDMEASAVCESVARLTPEGEVQLLKIVSDNLEQSVSEIDRELVGKLLRDALPAVASVIEAMREEPGRKTPS